MFSKESDQSMQYLCNTKSYVMNMELKSHQLSLTRSQVESGGIRSTRNNDDWFEQPVEIQEPFAAC